jgi:hypothetical protein
VDTPLFEEVGAFCLFETDPSYPGFQIRFGQGGPPPLSTHHPIVSSDFILSRTLFTNGKAILNGHQCSEYFFDDMPRGTAF